MGVTKMRTLPASSPEKIFHNCKIGNHEKSSRKNIMHLLWANQITEKHGKYYHDGFSSVIFEKLDVPL